MAFFSRNGSEKPADSSRKRRHSLNAWLLYFGIASMGLTGVTFSKYSTTITGTITVQVAQSFTVTYLDDNGRRSLGKVWSTRDSTPRRCRG